MLKSKAGHTEVTRADSESLMIESGPVKSIKKTKEPTKSILKKVASAQSKKVILTQKIKLYQEEENEEFTCKFRKEFANVKPLPKVQARRQFKFVEDNSIKNKLSSFPFSYEVEYQQPVEGFSDEERLCDYPESSCFPLKKSSKPAAKVSARTNKKTQAVSFNDLSQVLLKSRSNNVRAGTACFEVFKSLKIISLVSSYMNNDE